MISSWFLRGRDFGASKHHVLCPQPPLAPPSPLSHTFFNFVRYLTLVILNTVCLRIAPLLIHISDLIPPQISVELTPPSLSRIKSFLGD
jgi:hypothetical protein